MRASGQLDEARRGRSEADRRERAPTLSPRSREVLGLIDALSQSITRRTKPYGGVVEEIGLTSDEAERFARIVTATNGIMPVLTKQTQEALDGLAQSGAQSAAGCMGALDELRARVTSSGEQDDDEGPASTGGSTQVIIES